jgi:hypothetical protein
MEAKQRLWLTKDGKRLVADGNPQATTLYAAPGDEIPDETARRFGLKAGRLAKKQDRKQAPPPPNKEGKTPANKGSGGLKIVKLKGR